MREIRQLDRALRLMRFVGRTHILDKQGRPIPGLDVETWAAKRRMLADALDRGVFLDPQTLHEDAFTSSGSQGGGG